MTAAASKYLYDSSAPRNLRKPEHFILLGLILAIETSVICRLQAAAIGYKRK
jgi:hypothetical protein